MTFDEFIEEEKERDQVFRREWEEGEPEYQVIRTLVGERSRLGWTQKELACRMGTDQPTISRAENTGQVTPDFMVRFARAVGGDAALSVKLPGRGRMTFRLEPTTSAAGPSAPQSLNAVSVSQRRVTYRIVSSHPRQKPGPDSTAPHAGTRRGDEEAGAPATP